MAIFSKKNNAKTSDDKAKVILDESLSGSAVTDAPAKESTVAETAASEPAAVPAAAVGSVQAETAAASPAGPETAHDEVDPEPLVTPPVAPMEHRFGIDDAILLMRSLPADQNTALVVRVVRVTLGAVNVSVEEIVAEAIRKEAQIKEDIAALEGRIVELDGQLGALRREIATHQADLKETANVRERLHLAEQYSGAKPPPTPIAATMARLSSSKPIAS